MLLTEHRSLQAKYETIQQENSTCKKKQQDKEKQLKAKEAALFAREANQTERDQQITLLKVHINNLELQVKDLEEQNKLWKLKFLTSEEVRNKEPTIQQTTTQQQLPNMQQNVPSPNESILNNLTSMLHTALLTVTANLVQNMNTSPHSSPPNMHATPTYDHYRSHANDRTRNKYDQRYPRQSRHRDHNYTRRWRPAPKVYEYKHGSVAHASTQADISKYDVELNEVPLRNRASVTKEQVMHNHSNNLCRYLRS